MNVRAKHLLSPLRAISVFLLPVAVAATLGLLVPHVPFAGSAAPAVTTLQAVSVTASADLEALFKDLGYAWPPADDTGGNIPAVAVETLPKDFDTLSVKERKALFFRILAPLIATENRKLREQRAFLEQSFGRHTVLPKSGPVISRLRAIASRFNVSGDLNKAHTRATLLRRVDTIPAALVMAQAANESGWGTSRFAREANNLFGMWTWDRNAGLVPERRRDNARHFVRAYENLRASVANYLHTINVGPAYRELRELRAASRLRKDEPDALALAAGLRRYSARGDDYVREIRAIIEYNRLHELPPILIDAHTPRLPPAG